MPGDLASIRAVTFDCYGTLVDWEHGARAALARVASSRGREVDPEGLRIAWEEAQWRMILGPYRPYRDIVVASAVEALRGFGVDADEDDGLRVIAELPSWPAFPDTVPALARLRRRGLLVGILSNIDRDLIEATIDRAGLDVDLVVTAEEVKSYKPAEGHFKTALARLGLAAPQVVHAAFGFRYDLETAHRLRFVTAFVRRGRPAPAPSPGNGPSPDLSVDDVAALASALGA